MDCFCMLRPYSAIVTALVLVNLSVRCVAASRAYCPVPGSAISEGISEGIGSEPRVARYLVPEFESPGIAETDNISMTCSWELTLRSSPRQVLLEVISMSDLNNEERRKKKKRIQRRSILLEPISGDKWSSPLTLLVTRSSNETLSINLTIGSFMVMPMLENQHLNITVHGLKFGGKTDVAIRIVPIDPGYCDSNMTLHQGRCYYAFKQNSSVQNALQMVGDNPLVDLQLASFSNITDIRRFFNSNMSPDGVFPTKHPISFSKPMWIGLFRNQSKERKIVRFAETNASSCEQVEVLGLDSILSTAPLGLTDKFTCGSLRYNESSNQPLIEFSSCNQTMPAALFSFPDSPRPADVESQRVTCPNKISELLQPKLHDGKPKDSMISIIMIIIITSIGLFICGLFICGLRACICRILFNRAT